MARSGSRSIWAVRRAIWISRSSWAGTARRSATRYPMDPPQTGSNEPGEPEMSEILLCRQRVGDRQLRAAVERGRLAGVELEAVRVAVVGDDESKVLLRVLDPGLDH